MDGTGGIGVMSRGAWGNSGARLEQLPRLKLTAPGTQLPAKPEIKPNKPLREGEPVTKTEKPKQPPSEEVFKRISLEDFSKYLSQLNMSINLFAFDRDIRFDDTIKWYRVVIRNTETGAVIREIPPWDLSKVVQYIERQVEKHLDLVV
jgi:uncharacterized FlaG/YvyC family protein